MSGRLPVSDGYRRVVANILVVDDEARLARLICRVLREEGYMAVHVADGRSALRQALAEPFDMLVLDWMLPDLDGLGVIKRLRAADIDVPVLMLTARTQVEDRVEGLDAGADDYLPKPFAFSELLARVRALVRRPRHAAVETPRATRDITLHPLRHAVDRRGERIELTTREFALLSTLVARPGQVFTRAVLLDLVWGGSPDVYANVVDLYVSYLRKKLDRAGEPSYVRTVRGVGYAFEASTEER